MAKQQILLVDADPSSTRVLEVSLRSAGFTVTLADSAESALSVLEHTTPDLVLSDTQLPGVDGFELVKNMRAMPEMRDVPIVFLTEQGALEDKLRGLELGVDDYLAKPIFVREVITRVHMLLARRNQQRIAAETMARTRFSGSLQDVAVVDLLQTISVSHKSGVAVVEHGAHEAKLYFRDGQLIDASLGELEGEEAVYRAITWTRGSFDLEFRNVDCPTAIEVPTHALVMEGLRRVDELGRLSEQLPPEGTVIDLDHDALLDRLTEIPDELNGVLKLIDGRRTLLDLIDGSPFDDLSTLTVLSKFYFEGLIVERSPDAPPSELPATPRRSAAPLERASVAPHGATLEVRASVAPAATEDALATEEALLGARAAPPAQADVSDQLLAPRAGGQVSGKQTQVGVAPDSSPPAVLAAKSSQGTSVPAQAIVGLKSELEPREAQPRSLGSSHADRYDSRDSSPSTTPNPNAVVPAKGVGAQRSGSTRLGGLSVERPGPTSESVRAQPVPASSVSSSSSPQGPTAPRSGTVSVGVTAVPGPLPVSQAPRQPFPLAIEREKQVASPVPPPPTSLTPAAARVISETGTQSVRPPPAKAQSSSGGQGRGAELATSLPLASGAALAPEAARPSSPSSLAVVEDATPSRSAPGGPPMPPPGEHEASDAHEEPSAPSQPPDSEGPMISVRPLRPSESPEEDDFFEQGEEGTYEGGPRSVPAPVAVPAEVPDSYEREVAYRSTPAYHARRQKTASWVKLILSCAAVILGVAAISHWEELRAGFTRSPVSQPSELPDQPELELSNTSAEAPRSTARGRRSLQAPEPPLDPQPNAEGSASAPVEPSTSEAAQSPPRPSHAAAPVVGAPAELDQPKSSSIEPAPRVDRAQPPQRSKPRQRPRATKQRRQQPRAVSPRRKEAADLPKRSSPTVAPRVPQRTGDKPPTASFPID